jgi:hypothetical protein
MCQHLGVIPPETVSAAKEKFDAEANSNDTESSETKGPVQAEKVTNGTNDDGVVSKEDQAVAEAGVAATGDTAENSEQDETNGENDGEKEGDVAEEGEEDGGTEMEAEEGGEGGGEEDGEMDGEENTDENGEGDGNEEQAAPNTNKKDAVADNEDGAPPPPPKGSWQELQTLQQLSLGGKLHVVRKVALEMSRGLIGKLICEEAKNISEPPVIKTQEELELEQEMENEMTVEEKTARDEAEVKAKASIKWTAKLPYDIEGQATCQVVVFTVDQVTDILTQMRDSFLSLTSENWSHRHVNVAKISKRHVRKSLFDLEERLRLHWPRKGNADVMYMQPRIGEISAHRKRLERQKRNVNK